nr:probable E3 ubiquitin-protein ligase ARI8 [Tanacetum cinerariifolium]
MGIEADSTGFVLATQETLVNAKCVSDPDPLSYAKPRPIPEQDITQKMPVAEDPDFEKSTSFTFMVGSPGSIYQPGNNQLSQQVSTFQAQITGEERIKAAFEEFKKYEDDRVNSRCAELDARLDALSIDFDEELYPHVLTAIAGHQWVIGHGLRLTVMKCAESTKLRQVFADVMPAGIAKGMSEGLKHGVEHEKAKVDLAAIEAYDPEADTKYVAALHVLKDLKNAEDAQEAWFNGTEKVCKDIGLLHNEDIKSLEAKELMYGICFDSYPVNSIKTTGCVHPFCDICWTTYISLSINDGPGCLSLRCPDPPRHVAAGVNMVNILTSEEDRKKYHHYLLRTYIEHNRKAKWCPAPGCDCAVEFDIGSENYDVSCKSLHAFCWNMVSDLTESDLKILTASYPYLFISSMLNKRNLRCFGNGQFLPENLQDGIVGNTLGAAHLGTPIVRKPLYDEVESRREMAKNSLEKYTFFYERWAANGS